VFSLSLRDRVADIRLAASTADLFWFTAPIGRYSAALQLEVQIKLADLIEKDYERWWTPLFDVEEFQAQRASGKKPYWESLEERKRVFARFAEFMNDVELNTRECVRTIVE
jgi:hypothetical protein